MLSRRAVLFGVAAAGAAGFGRRLSAVQDTHSSLTAVNFDVPADACDCHTHIIGDPGRYPFAPSRTYTPAPASVAELQALHRALHIARVVIVQPSVYGTDNACTLDGMRQLGPGARGIAVVDDKTSSAEMDAMDRAGMRGIRINLATAGQTDPDLARKRFDAAVQWIGSRKWHIQMYVTLPVIAAIRSQVAASPVPVVFDHFGGAQAAGGVAQPGFDVLLDLVRTGRAHVKVSAPYRGSTQAPGFGDMGPLATALIAANAQRILWGTDWPHPDTTAVPGRTAMDVSPHRRVDDGLVFNQLAAWVPDPAVRKRILVDNPAALYGF
jgi:predicted TIM-barrel fold metal-dependent hydrolase